MNGETDLDRLLSTMDPVLNEGVYVFTTVHADVPDLTPVMVFTEAEGRTLIVHREDAARTGLDGVFPSAWITLRVHSSLAAVGLIAAVATALAEAGISCNPVSAHHHDHLFVPCADGERAVAVLRDLSERATRPPRG